MQPRAKSSHFTFFHIALHAVTAIFYLFLPQSCHSKRSTLSMSRSIIFHALAALSLYCRFGREEFCQMERKNYSAYFCRRNARTMKPCSLTRQYIDIWSNIEKKRNSKAIPSRPESTSKYSLSLLQFLSKQGECSYGLQTASFTLAIGFRNSKARRIRTNCNC